jgi:hypothetical protein
MAPRSATSRQWRRAGTLTALWLVLTAGTAAAQVVREEITIYVNEVTTWSPGYPMGDIVLGAPATAGYEPTNGRRELMLRGKAPGRTTLNIWDQKKTLRHEITLLVTTRAAESMEADLKALLAPYPDVQVGRLAGSIILTGTVATAAELAAVTNIARVAKVQSTVTALPATGRSGGAGPAAGAPAGAPGAGGSADAGAPAARTVVDYELELFEASTQFRTGGYGRGVEPSGRSLYKGSMRTAVGGEATIFIGGSALDPKARDPKKPDEDVETGIRLTLRPVPEGEGVVTAVDVETNVPLSYDLFDPEVWRRSRYRFTTTEGVPFAVAGNDLMASPDVVSSRGEAIRSTSRTAGNVSRLPGARRTGMQHVPVFGSLFGSSAYRQKTTQLLVVFRPTMSPEEPQP